MSAILLSGALVRATPARMKCVVHRTVKVIRRHASACIIGEKTYIIYIYTCMLSSKYGFGQSMDCLGQSMDPYFEQDRNK